MSTVMTCFALAVLLAGCKERPVTTLCIIGTAHDSTEFINPSTLYAAIERARPGVILCELETGHFTTDFELNTADFPDIATASNENITVSRYALDHNVLLRPYDIDGRNEFYRTSAYFEKEREVFNTISAAYEAGSLSYRSHDEWRRFLAAIPALDVVGYIPLEEFNSPLYTSYSDAKNKIVYNTLISITGRDFPHLTDHAVLLSGFWDKRNDVMADNILKWCDEFRGETILVLTGQQHKPELLARLGSGARHIELKEFWEFHANSAE